MNRVKDPVCGLMIDPETAAATTTYESQTIYFCSHDCRREFESDPAHFYDRLEYHEPRYTVVKSGEQ